MHRHGKRAGRRGRKRGLGSFVFPNTNLIAVLKRLNCLAFAIGVLLYYVKSLSSSVDMGELLFRSYRRIVHSADSSRSPLTTCIDGNRINTALHRNKMTFKRYLISAHIVLMKEDIHKSFIRKHQVRERGDDFVVFSDILALVRANNYRHKFRYRYLSKFSRSV